VSSGMYALLAVLGIFAFALLVWVVASLAGGAG